MSEHADTWSADYHQAYMEQRGMREAAEMQLVETMAALAEARRQTESAIENGAWNVDRLHERIAAAEAELAEARRERDEARKQLLAENVRVIYYKRLLPENARLKAALAPFLRRPRWLSIGSHENTAEIRVSREVYKEAVAALASGSEGDTA